jgi:FtsP/CotA-like multicopper oxidase with cupredoxin domain
LTDLGSSTAHSRRNFLAGGTVAFLCTIGGRQFEISSPADVEAADRAASKLTLGRTSASRRDPVDALKFGTPDPQPGGRVREYWIGARTRRWNIAPGPDQWMGARAGSRTSYTAYCYQPYTEGFAEPLGAASIPGPTLEAEVGDVLRVHFRNFDTALNQAVTMHPHGVRYTPDYDGAFYSDFTRAGGFVAPGEEFTYTWEATPDSVGVWPYHDHGPNHTINSLRGLFGAVIVRERGAKKPDVEKVLYLHSLPFQITKIPKTFQCFNGRSYAGNTPTVRAKVGQDVAFHVIGGDGEFHTFHIHGHRWKNSGGAHVDNPGFGPHESITARFTEDNPGRWLYHCHVFNHQDAGMAGWYLVSP